MTSHSPFDKQLLLPFKTGLRNQQRELQRVVKEIGSEMPLALPSRVLSMLWTRVVTTFLRNPWSCAVARAEVSCV
jgi:hypothetical protein